MFLKRFWKYVRMLKIKGAKAIVSERNRRLQRLIVNIFREVFFLIIVYWALTIEFWKIMKFRIQISVDVSSSVWSSTAALKQ